jgi:hypothetical protein
VYFEMVAVPACAPDTCVCVAAEGSLKSRGRTHRGSGLRKGATARGVRRVEDGSARRVLMCARLTSHCVVLRIVSHLFRHIRVPEEECELLLDARFTGSFNCGGVAHEVAHGRVP